MYESVDDLINAYKSGELTEPLFIDNDYVKVTIRGNDPSGVDDETVFQVEGDPVLVLVDMVQKLSNIPVEWA